MVKATPGKLHLQETRRGNSMCDNTAGLAISREERGEGRGGRRGGGHGVVVQ
jgi:hypothetical protein